MISRKPVRARRALLKKQGPPCPVPSGLGANRNHSVYVAVVAVDRKEPVLAAMSRRGRLWAVN